MIKNLPQDKAAIPIIHFATLQLISKFSAAKTNCMRLLLTAFFLTIYCFSLTAQNITIEQLKALKPRNIGPAGMSGRITAIDAVVSDPDTWYIGAASGGVWKTTNSGATWTPEFEEQPTLNI
jgi:hypothetical protein